MEQPVYLSEKALARRWSISHRTLQRWRWLDMGPAYLKIGGRVRYTEDAIKTFENESSFLNKSEKTASSLPETQIQREV